MFYFYLNMYKPSVYSIQIGTFFKWTLQNSIPAVPHMKCQKHRKSIERLVQFFSFKSEDFMAVNTSCQNYLKAIQYVEACLGILPLFCMVTSVLTDRNQSVLFHSPFPQFIFCLK
jgi:hypothetical protein